MVESGEADRPTKTLSHLGQANPCRPISPSRRRFREPATAACSAGSICRRVSGGVAAAIRAPAKTDREGDHRLGSRAARRGCAQFRLSQREVQAKGSVEAIFWAIAHARDAPKPTAPILGQAGRAELPGTDLRNTHRSRRGGQIPAGSISPDTGLRRSMPQAAGEAFFHAFRPLSDENGGLNGTDCAVRFWGGIHARDPPGTDAILIFTSSCAAARNFQYSPHDVVSLGSENMFDFLDSDDLQKLSRAIDARCRELSIRPDSIDGQMIASQLLGSKAD